MLHSLTTARRSNWLRTIQICLPTEATRSRVLASGWRLRTTFVRPWISTPSPPRVLQSAAWLMATCPEADVRNAELSVQAAEKAVKLLESAKQQPDSRYLDTLAASYANAGRFDDAVAKVTAAMQRAPAEQRGTSAETPGALPAQTAVPPIRRRENGCGE